MIRQRYSRRIGNAVTSIILAAISIPVQARETGSPKDTGNVWADAAPTPATPSLADVVQLLRTQAEEIENLRQALHEQQELTAVLVTRLNATPSGPASLDPASAAQSAVSAPTSPAQADLTQRLAKIEKDLTANQKDFDGRLRNLGPFSFSGDIRLRFEPTIQGAADQSQVQYRERYRLRFNADAKLNNELSGGFTLASGDLNNPTSTNQTTNQFYSRKPIAIDRAVLTYTPHYFKAFSISAGKFYPPWVSNELVWDKDLNPEGLTQSLTFTFKDSPLQRLKVVGFELPFSQYKRNDTTPVVNKSTASSVLYGGQIQTTWKITKRVNLEAYSAFYNFIHADTIAAALVAPTANFSSTNAQSPLQGLLPLNNSGNLNSIATVTTSGAITSAQFASKFAILDSIARLTIQTSSERWPIQIMGDFAQNTRACGNVGSIPVTAVFNRPCNSADRQAYWLESRVGRATQKGDWQFAYAHYVMQQEAVIGAFNNSEILPPNNGTQHRFEIDYQLYRGVGLAFVDMIGRPLVTPSTPLQPWSQRMQFDVNYRF